MSFFDSAFFDASFFDATPPVEPETFPFVLSLPSVTGIKANEATPVVQVNYQ